MLLWTIGILILYAGPKKLGMRAANIILGCETKFC